MADNLRYLIPANSMVLNEATRLKRKDPPNVCSDYLPNSKRQGVMQNSYVEALNVKETQNRPTFVKYLPYFHILQPEITELPPNFQKFFQFYEKELDSTADKLLAESKQLRERNDALIQEKKRIDQENLYIEIQNKLILSVIEKYKESLFPSHPQKHLSSPYPNHPSHFGMWNSESHFKPPSHLLYTQYPH